MKKILFVKPWISKKDLIRTASKLDVNNLGGSGQISLKLEKKIEKILNVPKCFLVNSCTDALEISLLALDLKENDEVICPSYAFVSTVSSIIKAGGKVVFIDIEKKSYGLDPEIIKKAINKKTRAVVLVHYGGIPAKVKEIRDICFNSGIKLIEDAAQSFFSKKDEKYIGTYGDFGCFSFHQTKNVTAGEGGLLVVNNKKLIKICEEIKNFGTNRESFRRGEVKEYNWQRIGGSYFMTEFQAALILNQITKYQKIILKRKNICLEYYKRLKILEQDQIKISKHPSVSGYHLFWIICRSRKERNKLLKFLQASKIQASTHYLPLHLSPYVINNPDKFRKVGTMETTIHISEQILRLPLFPELTIKEVETVCLKVLEFYKK